MIEIPPDWADALSCSQAFQREQANLERSWAFLGLTFDVEKDGDWLRASIGLRSVFVQRFGSELRGYENRCAHRFYPLRNSDRGNGPVICGFHGWQYDREGKAVGIPQSRDAFCALPHELGARLARLELAVCGTMIFGRFAGQGDGETLPEFLSTGFPILEALSRAETGPPCVKDPVEANWKLCLHASLDDYHLVNIHPSTLGRGGPIPLQNVKYHRFGRQMAYFNSSKDRPFEAMVDALKEGNFEPTDFSIFHICPNTFLVLFHAYASHWYCGIVHYQALATDRSVMRAWIYPAPFQGRIAGIARYPRTWFKRISEYVRAPIVRLIARRIFREDHMACEALQRNAASFDRPPRLSAFETRILWFEQSYAELTARA